MARISRSSLLIIEINIACSRIWPHMKSALKQTVSQVSINLQPRCALLRSLGEPLLAAQLDWTRVNQEALPTGQ
jgi:hypothetical protein